METIDLEIERAIQAFHPAWLDALTAGISWIGFPPPGNGTVQIWGASFPNDAANAICFPSGDHVGRPVTSAAVVSWAICLSTIVTTASSAGLPGSRFAMAMTLPSGDQAGPLLIELPLVSWTGSLPGSTSQIWGLPSATR